MLSRAMILFPKLPIPPLQHLQPLLFNLTPGQILHNPIIYILPVEHIRRQRMLIIHHLKRQVLVSLIVDLTIPQHLHQPPTRQLAIALIDLFR